MPGDLCNRPAGSQRPAAIAKRFGVVLAEHGSSARSASGCDTVLVAGKARIGPSSGADLLASLRKSHHADADEDVVVLVGKIA